MPRSTLTFLVTASKWFGLTHALFLQRWSGSSSLGIFPLANSYEIRCALIFLRLPGHPTCTYPYPLHSFAPIQFQHGPKSGLFAGVGPLLSTFAQNRSSEYIYRFRKRKPKKKPAQPYFKAAPVLLTEPYKTYFC